MTLLEYLKSILPEKDAKALAWLFMWTVVNHIDEMSPLTSDETTKLNESLFEIWQAHFPPGIPKMEGQKQ